MSRPPSRATTRNTKPAASTSESSDPDIFKRLIVCCDGTWLDASGSLDDGKLDPPSNVTRLTRAIRAESRDGIQQIVYYQAGIGSTGGVFNKVVGGAVGLGLAENVREAYSFVANNYHDGDEIFLIGFSRGAFTARSVAGLIGAMGVMTKEGLPFFPVVYKDWAHRHSRSYRSSQPNIPFSRKPSASNPDYAQELGRRGFSALNVRIKMVAVFDTVGSLGVPELGFLGPLNKVTGHSSQYAFYDTTLDNCIDNAYQALALDEHRESFAPCLWEKRGNTKTNLLQVWFPGVHSNIGGGYPDQGMANITLAWMMSMLDDFLDFNLEYIPKQEIENEDYYREAGKRQRAWSFGKIYDSVVQFYVLGGKTDRTPGDYNRTDPKTGEETRIPLRDTHEYIHASARSRYVLHGPGYADKGEYDPASLKNWKLRSSRSNGKDPPTNWYWEERRSDPLILPEAPIRSLERMLLRATPHTDPDVWEYLQDTTTFKKH